MDRLVREIHKERGPRSIGRLSSTCSIATSLCEKPMLRAHVRGRESTYTSKKSIEIGKRAIGKEEVESYLNIKYVTKACKNPRASE